MIESERQYHEVANIFPLMSGEEFDALKSDIAANGQQEPVWIHPDGSIIDGRNRHRACLALGITPTLRTWHGNGSLISFVISLNLHRRHLTSSQRAAIAVDILPMLEAEAKERQGKRTDLQPTGETLFGETLLKNLSNVETVKNESTAAAQAASALNTNRQYVADLKTIAAADPVLFERVKNGERSVTQAKREHRQNTAPAAAALPSAKYRVIYADPPWQYGNTQPDYHTEQADHYRLMTMAEICALPIAQMAEDNAVLFLWVTSPILAESFAVIDAWGFKYKSSFVWDKVKHNMGHYNSVRHEFLLICVRGSCQPDVLKLFDSVQTIERTEHSRKPEEFRTIIDTIYTLGRRVELFARTAAPGWDVWGNEVKA